MPSPSLSPEWLPVPLPPQPAGTAPLRFYDLAGSAPNDLWAVATSLRLHFDGTAWRQDTNPDWVRAARAISSVSRSDVWAVGVYGSIAHFDGTRWHSEKLPGVDFDLIRVMAWPGAVWVTAAGKEIFRFDGTRWSSDTPAELGGRGIRELWGTSPRDVHVLLPSGAGDLPQIGHFDGTRFAVSAVGRPGLLHKVHGSGSHDVWAVGSTKKLFGQGGQIQHFDGTRWTETPIPIDKPVHAVYATSPTEAYACGEDGLILRWDGRSWLSSSSGTTQRLTVLFAPAGIQPLVAGTTLLQRK